MRRKMIAVLGDATVEKDSAKYRLTVEIGKALVDAGYRVCSGGLGGAMEAVFIGAHQSEKYREGDTVAVIPTFNEQDANPYADIIIPTGVNVLRNGITTAVDAVVAIGGGAGTLSEIAFAWSHKRLIIGVTGVGGWSEKLAGQRVDERIRYPYEDDQVFPAADAAQCVRLLREKADLYTRHRTEFK